MPICWAFELDQTTTHVHSYATKMGQEMTHEQRWANIREAEALKRFILDRKAQGDLFIITTNHRDRTHVESYLETLVGENWKEFFSSIQIDRADFKKPYRTKVDYIRDAFKEMHINIERFGRQNIILVDDNQKNIDDARTAGFETVLVKPRIEYLITLRDIARNHVCRNQGFFKPPKTLRDGHASKKGDEGTPLVDGTTQQRCGCCTIL